MEERTEPDQATQTAEEAEAVHNHTADRPPTEAETATADEHLAKSDDAERAKVAEHEEEMMEIGAKVKGEGAID